MSIVAGCVNPYRYRLHLTSNIYCSAPALIFSHLLIQGREPAEESAAAAAVTTPAACTTTGPDAPRKRVRSTAAIAGPRVRARAARSPAAARRDGRRHDLVPARGRARACGRGGQACGARRRREHAGEEGRCLCCCDRRQVRDRRTHSRAQTTVAHRSSRTRV